MGLNTQFPEWMQRATDSNRAAGAQLGQNILQGLRFQQGVKQQEFENQNLLQQQALQNRNLTEIQDAQLLINQSQATMQRLAAQKAALDAERRVQGDSADADLLALDTEFASSPNGYNNENEARLYQFVREKPGARFSSLYPQLIKKFEIYRESERDLTRRETELAAQMALAATKPARTSAAFNDSLRIAESMAARGEIPADQVEKKAEELYAYKEKTATMKNAEFAVDAALKAGFEGDPAKLMEIAANNNGKIPIMTEQNVVKFGERAAVLELTDSVLDKVDQFNAKYGKDAIDSYVGQFDAPFDQALDLIRKRGAPKDLDALEILQTFEDVRTGKIKANSGLTVTKAEQDRMDKVIGTTLNKNFVSALKTFNNNDRAVYKTQLEGFSDRIIPDSIKRPLSVKRRELYPAEQKTQAPRAPSGSPVTINTQAEYDSLPSGSKYVDSTGKVKTKR
jgi:hypothetical protein